MPLDPDRFGEQLVKNRTIRGTLHAYAETDLPLFYMQAEQYMRAVDTKRQKTNLSVQNAKKLWLI